MHNSQSLESQSMIHISSTQHNPEKEPEGPFESNAIQVEEHSMQEQAIEIRKLFKERETKLMSELQDAKDQAELLEFRVLELEEEQEKVDVRIDISFVYNSPYNTACFDFALSLLYLLYAAKTASFHQISGGAQKGRKRSP